MRRTLALAVIALATPALAELPPDLPKRQPGLWQMSNTMVEMGGMTMSVQTCIDERSDDLAMQEQDMECGKQHYRMDGPNRVLFEGECQAEGSRATVKGAFTGDFSRNYAGEIVSTYDPPLQGMQKATMKMQAKWVGPCKPGQKPGDVEMMGMDLGDMMKNLPQRPN